MKVKKIDNFIYSKLFSVEVSHNNSSTIQQFILKFLSLHLIRHIQRFVPFILRVPY